MLNLIQYVHLNPKHHLDLDYKNFQFSSYQSIISDKPTRLLRDEVIQLFDSLENYIYCHEYKSEILTEKHMLE